MRRPTRTLAIVGVLLVTLLAGCSLPWPFSQSTPDLRLPDSQQILRPQEAGTAPRDLDGLDPALIAGPSSEQNLAQLLFPGLLTLDEQSRPVDWVAERHEVSADGLTYTFHLRKGMTWSDGTPIDATTFAYSINRALDP
jgi:oligopeptide transport system substrate-binding protein